MNKAILVGRLGADPEARYTTSGTAITTFNLATTERWKKNGEKQEKTEWHRCVAWGKLGEICGEHLKKGSLVAVDGRVETRSWDDKDGKKRYTTEINLKELEMLGGGNQGSANSPLPDDDEIPF